LAIGLSSIILNIGTPIQFGSSCELDTIYNQQSHSGSVSLLESTMRAGDRTVVVTAAPGRPQKINGVIL
jgi:hypothetical protein